MDRYHLQPPGRVTRGVPADVSEELAVFFHQGDEPALVGSEQGRDLVAVVVFSASVVVRGHIGSKSDERAGKERPEDLNRQVGQRGQVERGAVADVHGVLLS